MGFLLRKSRKWIHSDSFAIIFYRSRTVKAKIKNKNISKMKKVGFFDRKVREERYREKEPEWIRRGLERVKRMRERGERKTIKKQGEKEIEKEWSAKQRERKKKKEKMRERGSEKEKEKDKGRIEIDREIKRTGEREREREGENVIHLLFF